MRRTLFTCDLDSTHRLVSFPGEIAGTAQALMDAFIGEAPRGCNVGLFHRLWERLYREPLPRGLITAVQCQLAPASVLSTAAWVRKNDQAKQTVIVWGYVSRLPQDLTTGSYRADKRVRSTVVCASHRFLVALKRRSLHHWLRKVLLYDGLEIARGAVRPLGHECPVSPSRRSPVPAGRETLQALLAAVPEASQHVPTTIPQAGWPPGWLDDQRWANPIPTPLLPYLDLAAILHIGDFTHYGYGTFRLN